MSLKMAFLKLLTHRPGINELKYDFRQTWNWAAPVKREQLLGAFLLVIFFPHFIVDVIIYQLFHVSKKAPGHR